MTKDGGCVHGVAAAVGAWLDAGEDPVVARAPLAEGMGGAGPGEVLAFGPDGQIHGPAGLDLGGNSAGEIALSICAEVLATRTGRAPLSLRATSGPIHR